MGTSAENRVHQRHSVRLDADVMLVERGSDKVVTTTKGYVLDVSYGGLKLEIGAVPAATLRDLEAGQLVLLIAARHDDQVLQLGGRTAWTKVAAGDRLLLGVRFVAANSHDVQKLVGWTEERRQPARWVVWVPRAAISVTLVTLALLWRGADGRAGDAEAALERELADRDRREHATDVATPAGDPEPPITPPKVDAVATAVPDAGARAASATDAADPRTPVAYLVRFLDATGSGNAEVQVASLRVDDGVLFGVLERTNRRSANPLTVRLEIEILDRGRAAGAAATPAPRCTVDPMEVGPTATLVEFDCGLEAPADSVLLVTMTQSLAR